MAGFDPLAVSGLGARMGVTDALSPASDARCHMQRSVKLYHKFYMIYKYTYMIIDSVEGYSTLKQHVIMVVT